MGKNTRNRQLAKLHQRRLAERRQQQRKRQMATIAIALVVALIGGALAFVAFAGGDETPPAATGSTGATGATGPTASNQTSTVRPEPGPEEVACGASQPKDALRPKPQFSSPAQVLKEGKTYTAEIQTSCGAIVIELLADQAPQTVNSFVFLARQGFFDGQRIHRLDTSIDVIQGGDPTGTGTGGPGYTVPDELTGDESYGAGTLAMANSGSPDSGGSQFFLITGPNGHGLDANPAYTIFGTVIEGLDVAKRIQELPIQDPGGDISGQQPEQAVYLEKVTIQVGG